MPDGVSRLRERMISCELGHVCKGRDFCVFSSDVFQTVTMTVDLPLARYVDTRPFQCL